MNNKNCGPDIVKYFIVEPSGSGASGGCNDILLVNTISACTNTISINSPVLFNYSFSACTGIHTSNIYGCSPITLHSDIIPVNDETIDLGSPIKRFRNVNTVSGTSSVWSSTISVTTPSLHLGLDSSGNTRTITAENSIIQDDVLLGGNY